MSNFSTVEIMPSAYSFDPRSGESVFSKAENLPIFMDPYPDKTTINYITFEGANFQKFFDLIWNYKNFYVSFSFDASADVIGEGPSQGDFSKISAAWFGNFLNANVSLIRSGEQIIELTHYDYGGQFSDIETKIAAKVREVSSTNGDTSHFLMHEEPNLFSLPNLETTFLDPSSPALVSMQEYAYFTNDWTNCSAEGLLVDGQQGSLIDFKFKSVFIDPTIPKLNLYFNFQVNSRFGYVQPTGMEIPNGFAGETFALNFILNNTSLQTSMNFIYDPSSWEGLLINVSDFIIEGANPL